MLLLPLGAMAQTTAPDPATLPARDSHQGLLIAAIPVVSASRYKELFAKNSPFDAGIIAIDTFFRNDNDAPIRLNLNTIQLIIYLPGVDRQRLTALTPEEVADRTVLTADSNPRVPRPFPFPSGGGNKKSKAWTELDTALRSVSISTDILPPHATTRGLLFFDMNHDVEALRHSHLYIPDLMFMTDKSALFYFEIDLAATQKK